MANYPELPADPDLAGKVIEANTKNRRLEMGTIGRFFGAASEKPGNIAGFVIVLSFLMLTGIFVFGGDTASFTKKDAVAVVAGFISLALGFLFGRASIDRE